MDELDFFKGLVFALGVDAVGLIFILLVLEFAR